MTFYTAISCIDGRIHLQLIDFLRERFEIEHVDLVTAPGPVRLFFDDKNLETRQELLDQVALSFDAHNSNGLALVAHYDCAGNPKSEKQQKAQLHKGKELLERIFPNKAIQILWINQNWEVEEL